MSYYEEVGNYYDKDAVDFEQRYWKNPVLQRIRQSFREEVKEFPFRRALEIGFGPGFDLIHFARIFPGAEMCGIDVSEEMVQLAQQKIEAHALTNVRVGQGSVEHITEHFPEASFDLIYVFFGALNTVEDIEQAFECLADHLEEGGRMVLTFVNKWYLQGMLIELLKGRPVQAFSRLKKVWGGYSPTEFLASRCYSPAEISRCAERVGLKLCTRSGYSIVSPAWYYHGLNRRLPSRIRQAAWNLDRRIANGPLGGLGEYALYDLRKDGSK